MVSQNVNQIYKAVEALTDREREELRQMLNERAKLFPADENVVSQRQADRRKWVQEMTKKGIRVTVAPEPTPEQWAEFLAWHPVQMPGPSLSDELIRDRR